MALQENDGRFKIYIIWNADPILTILYQRRNKNKRIQNFNANPILALR